jgi:predicted amidohydrolase
MTLLLKGGRMIDPSRKVDRTGDLLIENGRLRKAFPARRFWISGGRSSSPA